jgi:hypothetical protein
MGRYITTIGTASPVLRTVATTYTAVVNDRILINSASAAFTITLPAVGTLLEGDQIQFIDVGNSLQTNNVLIARNSALILGVADDLTLDINGAIVTILYTGATYGWVMTST